MHTIFNDPETVCLVLFSLLCMACSSPTKVNETYQPATDLYSQPINESAILQDEESKMVFAGDQVLVLTKDVLVGKEVLDAIAAEHGMKLVGAIPDIGMYQFKTPPLDIPGQKALLDRIRQNPIVESAIPNYLISNNALHVGP